MDNLNDYVNAYLLADGSHVRKRVMPLVLLSVLLSACAEPAKPPEGQAESAPVAAAPAQVVSIAENVEGANPLNNLYWGDTHLHTNYSPDAYVNRNTTATPDDAYQFAKGAPVLDALTRAKIQIDTPLDFLVVADHAEYVGIPKLLWDGDPRVANTPTGKRYIEMIKAGKGTDVFFELITSVNTREPISDLVDDKVQMSMWSEIVDAADRHNDPGNFTAFIGWEWSSLPQGQNLHRIIFQSQGGDIAKQYRPISAMDSDVEGDFWDWLEETSARTGADFVTIPHNGNISGGMMFPAVDRAGNPIDAAYAEQRMRWEQIYEVTQIKGDSETHPLLSPNDEFADFETYEHLIKNVEGDENEADAPDELAIKKRSYGRSALLLGLEYEQQIGVNPFKYGFIGSTDSHSGYATAEEDNFWGKFSLDSIPDNKKDIELAPGAVGWDMSGSGLAAVWARENTRQAITDAFKRREVYATSGPRIALRFFGGFDFNEADLNAANMAEAGYARGVPMGADLAASQGAAPSFMIRAVKDPKHANLDRIQIVKGFTDANGVAQEKVYNVAWSGERRLDANGKLTAVGNTVDLSTGRYSNRIGDTQLAAVWTDPDFDPAARAFYYVRVLQIPTPRNSTYDAIAMGIDPAETGKPLTIQERAYSSPIWYTP